VCLGSILRSSWLSMEFRLTTSLPTFKSLWWRHSYYTLLEVYCDVD
jgi:hypothetical protein